MGSRENTAFSSKLQRSSTHLFPRLRYFLSGIRFVSPFFLLIIPNQENLVKAHRMTPRGFPCIRGILIL